MAGALVSTDWVADRCADPGVVVVEVGLGPMSSPAPRIPGAVRWSWTEHLHGDTPGDLPSAHQVETLLSGSGIDNYATVVLHGESGDSVAAFGFWLLRLHGHKDLRLMEGGRGKWVREGKPVTDEPPLRVPSNYRVGAPNPRLRADLSDVLAIVDTPSEAVLLDVRSPRESQACLTPQDASARVSHIPGAINLPWEELMNAEGTLLPLDDLRRLFDSRGVGPDREVITYCEKGDRSAYTWFVLSELLRYPNARHYDGAWPDYSSAVDVQTEKLPMAARPVKE